MSAAEENEVNETSEPSELVGQLASAVHWENGMVTAFDRKGKQIVALQGKYEEVKARVLAASTDQTEWLRASWRGSAVVTSREAW